MADPYASRVVDPAGEVPAGEPPWWNQLSGAVFPQPLSGDEVLGSVDVDLPGPVWTAIVVRDAGVLAPVARLTPELAAAFAAWQHGRAASAERWRREVTPGDPGGWEGVLLLKHGWVAGPPPQPGCIEVTADLLRPALEANANPDREILWERDPDFGYEVPARVDGLDEASCRVLCPRLHYADHDRVYEHAELVAETKRHWFERLSEVEDVPAEVLAAIGWPPQPTGDEWRERTR